MTPRFLAMIPWLFKWEGTTYENDPSDPGGATKYGIDQRSHPNEDIRNLTEDRAKEIYWEVYWNGGHSDVMDLLPVCENLGPGLGEAHFNARVNTGKGRAKQFLSASDRNASEYLNQMDAFYRRLAAARPASQKYLRGWLNRTADLRQFLGLV